MRLFAALAAVGSSVSRRVSRNLEVTLCFVLIYLSFCYYDLWCRSANGQWTTKAIILVTGRDICVSLSVRDPVTGAVQSIQNVENAFDLPVTAPIPKWFAYPIVDQVGKWSGAAKWYNEDFKDGKELRSWTKKAQNQAHTLVDLAYEHDSSIRAAQSSALFALEDFAFWADYISSATRTASPPSAVARMAASFARRVLPSGVMPLTGDEQLALRYSEFTSELRPKITRHLKNSRHLKDQLEVMMGYLEQVKQSLDREIEHRHANCTQWAMDRGLIDNVHRWLFGQAAESMSLERRCGECTSFECNAEGDMGRMCCRPLQAWQGFVTVHIGNVGEAVNNTEREIRGWMEVEQGLRRIEHNSSSPPEDLVREQGSSVLSLQGRVEDLKIKLEDRREMMHAYWHDPSEPWRRMELPSPKIPSPKT